MNKFTFLFFLLVLCFRLNGQNAYCFTVTEVSSNANSVTFSFQLIHNVAAGADYSINISGTNGLASNAGTFNNYLAGANDVAMVPGAHTGTFTFTKTGASPYTIFVDESLPEYGVVIANTSTLIPKDCNNPALPILLKSFTAKPVEYKSLLNWETSAEVLSSHYEVERSSNGIQFAKIGRVIAAGSVRSAKTYEYTDENPLPGVNYYRLRMVDKDDKFAYSHIAEVNFEDDIAVQILPNPTKGAVELMFTASTEGSTTVNVLDISGRLLQTRTIERQRGSNSVSLDLGSLAQGVYWIALLDETGTKSYRVVRAE